MRYITTYFYHDIEDMGATYGNIFLPLVKRNEVYWKTVYTCFFSAVTCNKGCNVGFVLFTNIRDFPFRAEIEALGVKIYDDLTLTARNQGKWATVKFFFDVVHFIVHHKDFFDDDAFVMLDTDVVALSSAGPLFDHLKLQDNAVAYIFDSEINNAIFHDTHLSRLEGMGFLAFGVRSKIKGLVGGEFFCFNKRHAFVILDQVQVLRDLNIYNDLVTEEQILTLLHSRKPWSEFPRAIYRVWTTFRSFKVPDDLNYIFLHLPSEKESGLAVLFERTRYITPFNLTVDDFRSLFHQSIPLNRRYIIYLTKAKNRFCRLLGL